MIWKEMTDTMMRIQSDGQFYNIFTTKTFLSHVTLMFRKMDHDDDDDVHLGVDTLSVNIRARFGAESLKEVKTPNNNGSEMSSESPPPFYSKNTKMISVGGGGGWWWC